MGTLKRAFANNIRTDGKPLSLEPTTVTAHSPETDLQPIKSDITALALREATNEASAAFNLPNQFIETFTDDTNLGTQTDGDRQSGYWGSIVEGTFPFADDSYTELLIHSNTSDGSTTFTDSSHNARTITRVGTVTNSTTQAKFGTSSIYFNGGAAVDTALQFADSADFDFGSGAFTIEFWGYNLNGSTDAGLWGEDNQYYPPTQTVIQNISGGRRVKFWATASPGSSFSIMAAQSLGVSVADTWEHWAITRDGNDFSLYREGTRTTLVTDSGTIGTNSDAVRLGGGAGATQSPYGWIDEVRISKGIARYTGASYTVPTPITTVNATGTLIQSANAVGSAKTKVGGTFLYKDNAGTATLGSANDLAIYFTCNGGTNWTEAAGYTAITPVYSTGIKQVRLSETTCTGGTDVRYKAVWANQSSGSKETQLHGIGINY